MNDSPSPDQTALIEYDPIFLHSRREAIVIFCVWLAGLVWAVPFCYFNGYVDPAAAVNISTIWGIPSWLFWGIGVPWILADLFTVWFCFFYMADDDLGEIHEGVDIEEEIAELHAAKTAQSEDNS